MTRNNITGYYYENKLVNTINTHLAEMHLQVALHYPTTFFRISERCVFLGSHLSEMRKKRMGRCVATWRYISPRCSRLVLIYDGCIPSCISGKQRINNIFYKGVIQ